MHPQPRSPAAVCPCDVGSQLPAVCSRWAGRDLHLLMNLTLPWRGEGRACVCVCVCVCSRPRRARHTCHAHTTLAWLTSPVEFHMIF